MFGIFILWHQWSSNFKLFFILLKTTLQVVLELETSSSGVPRYDCATSAGLSLSISIRTIYLFCLFHPVHEILGRFTLRSWTLESVGSNDWLRHEWRWDEGHDFFRQLSFSFSPFFLSISLDMSYLWEMDLIPCPVLMVPPMSWSDNLGAIGLKPCQPSVSLVPRI